MAQVKQGKWLIKAAVCLLLRGYETEYLTIGTSWYSNFKNNSLRYSLQKFIVQKWKMLHKSYCLSKITISTLTLLAISIQFCWSLVQGWKTFGILEFQTDIFIFAGYLKGTSISNIFHKRVHRQVSAFQDKVKVLYIIPY